MSDEFSVAQFFANETYEYVRRNVDAQNAVEAAHFFTTNVAARLGMVRRVIITDGDDFCVFEWKFADGEGGT